MHVTVTISIYVTCLHETRRQPNIRRNVMCCAERTTVVKYGFVCERTEAENAVCYKSNIISRRLCPSRVHNGGVPAGAAIVRAGAIMSTFVCVMCVCVYVVYVCLCLHTHLNV